MNSGLKIKIPKYKSKINIKLYNTLILKIKTKKK